MLAKFACGQTKLEFLKSKMTKNHCQRVDTEEVVKGFGAEIFEERIFVSRQTSHVLSTLPRKMFEVIKSSE